MTATLINPGLVRVTPDVLDENDVLELGEALIEQYGHKKGDSGNETTGFSIHGAVGEAAKRATGESGKDGSKSRVLRDKAAAKLAEKNGGRTEFDLNDNAADAAEAVALMRAARTGATI